MAEHDEKDHRHHTVAWVLGTLGAGAAAVGGWLWARTRRDRLVAEAGTAVHSDPETEVGAEASETDS